MQASMGPHVGAAPPVGPSVVVAALAGASEAGVEAEAEAEAEDGAPATCTVITLDRMVPAQEMGSVAGQMARSYLCSRFWLQTWVLLRMFGLCSCGYVLTSGTVALVNCQRRPCRVVRDNRPRTAGRDFVRGEPQ